MLWILSTSLMFHLCWTLDKALPTQILSQKHKGAIIRWCHGLPNNSCKILCILKRFRAVNAILRWREYEIYPCKSFSNCMDNITQLFIQWERRHAHKKKLHAVIAITVLTELGQSIHITALVQVEFRLPLLVKTSTAKKVVGNKYEHCTPVNGRIRVKEWTRWYGSRFWKVPTNSANYSFRNVLVIRQGPALLMKKSL